MRLRPLVDFAAGLPKFEFPDPRDVVILNLESKRLRQRYTLAGKAIAKARKRGIAKRKGYGKRPKSRVVYA